MGLVIEAAIAKTGKYASRESGDSAELVERPGGGLSVVLIDGQGSGPAARSLSLWLSAHAVALIKDGVRAGVAARAVHDRLFAFRHGQVSATLDIVSVDLRTKTLLVTRNASTPLLVGRAGVTDAVVREVDEALEARELIKVRLSGDRDERARAAAAIAQRTGAEVAGRVGRIAILYRENPDPARRRIALPPA